MPEARILPFYSLRIPTYPEHALHLDDSPLQIISHRPDPGETIPSATPPEGFTPAIAIATILYNWHPDALLAFLDTRTWVTFTWNLRLGDGRQIEIGRVRGRVMVGELDAKEEWTWATAWDMTKSGKEDDDDDEDGWFEGKWVVDCRDSFLNAVSAQGKTLEEVNSHARRELWDWILASRWETGKKLRHHLFVESAALGVDAWSDGLQISPHWLYRAMDLGRCTFCGREGGEGLKKCRKCGTATYCGVECQKGDWKVHKGVCGMGLEERGKALFYSRGEGGLAGARARTPGVEDGKEEDDEDDEDDEEEDDEEEDDEEDEGPGWVIEGGSRSVAELRKMPAKLSEKEVKETVDMMEQMMREASRR
ncbi:unnamed protein product [Zymoseptoria tritici ST99CH_3D7]|uniref:MYND-type domain-containing protein n=1 Tax=Zymoseptoria tritici (strain ST99CH_3D7) TaxID=1276538 RepID=A0A1X7RRG0_ZYMT9|nr:unnamed protein product [Zymoseptoria tritici ST99CH_3D7]